MLLFVVAFSSWILSSNFVPKCSSLVFRLISDQYSVSISGQDITDRESLFSQSSNNVKMVT